MKKSFLFFILASLFVQSCEPVFALISEPDKAQLSSRNVLTNPGAESSTAAWAASGGTFITTTTAANVGSGNAAFSWDSSSAAQTMASAYQTVTSGAGYSTQNGIVSCRFKCASGSCTHTLEAYDGSNKLVSQAIVSSTTGFVRATAFFTYPVSGTVRLQVSSVASNEPVVYVDDCYQGLAESSPPTVVTGLAGSNTVSFPMVVTSTGSSPTKGTIDQDVAHWERHGDRMEITYGFRQVGVGSAGSGNYLYNLPSGYSIDLAKINNEAGGSGQYGICGPARAADSGSSGWGFVWVNTATTLRVTVGNATTNLSPVGASNFADYSNNAASVAFTCTVPIVGWDANVTMSNSSQFQISSYLANGTRVTTTPANLGEYRSRYKSTSSSNTFADVAPTDIPSIADGIRVDAIDYTAAQTSGRISLYDVFIGKNKSWAKQCYLSTGRSGSVQTDYYVESSTSAKGTKFSYDPSTGVITIDAGIANLATNTGRSAGLDPATTNGAATIYCDIIVSENALAVGLQSKVVVEAAGTATGTLTNAFNDTVFPTEIKDTHSAYDSSTGIFTAPRTDSYFICASSIISFSAASVNQQISFVVSKNNSATYSAIWLTRLAALETAAGVGGCVLVDANVGDTLRIKGYCDAGSGAYSGSAGGNTLSIMSVN